MAVKRKRQEAVPVWRELLDWSARELAQMRARGAPQDAELQALCVAVLQHFEGRQGLAALWFKTPNPSLGDIAPRDMIRYGRFEGLQRMVAEAVAENAAGIGRHETREMI